MSSAPLTDPAHFFQDVVPRLARSKARAFPALAQKVCVIVDGRGWTLTLHDDAAPVMEGADATAGFTLWLSQEAFDALLEGTLDVERAITARAVGVAGDLRALEQLGRLLVGPKSPVGARGAGGAP